MSSSYKDQDLFGSGPHRFVLEKQGYQTLTRIFFGDISPGTIPIGLVEPAVRVVGRLVSTSESGLWVLRDQIDAALVLGQTAGELEDQWGRVFPDMWFLKFETGEVERGSRYSVSYEALFVDVNDTEMPSF